jgi:hypothetical protein
MGSRDCSSRRGDIGLPHARHLADSLVARPAAGWRWLMTAVPPVAGSSGVVVFLGAGFSYVAGVPLAAHLFDVEPTVDRITRQRLVERVQRGWRRWHDACRGSPEEYLAELEGTGGPEWRDAVWYVGLVVALQMGRLQRVGFQDQLTVTRQNIDRTTQNQIHESFWTAIFRSTSAVTVITTNYDVLAERGLRIIPRPRVPRPGFHYGFGEEYLAGGGYPSFSHIRRIVTEGSIPLLKLHGSVSWSIRDGRLVKYHDCRPAIGGDALLVAPVRGKRPPEVLLPTWELARTALANASVVISVGYSLPTYDDLVCELLAATAHDASFHLLDPDPAIGDRYRDKLNRNIVQHAGLPDALPDVAVACEAVG